MKFRLLSATLLLFTAAAFSQDNDRSYRLNEKGCATPPDAAQVQRVYDFVQHNPLAYAKTNDGAAVDTIPLTVHIAGQDNGTGYYQLSRLFTLLCQLNERYAPVHFYFALQWPVHYINNSEFYVHDWQGGSDMMEQNNVAGTANIYFVQDPAGACGYYAGWNDAIAISNSCAASNSTTLVHELGHFFSLPHTFYGWEGGTEPVNPEKVTRGAGANCNTAGDGFCDTDADYISDRWYCPYNGTMLDQTGTPYHPDSSIYMSYSLDDCQSRFSDQQIAMMQYDRATFHAGLVADYPAWSALSTPQLVYPSDTLYANLHQIRWHPVAGAEYYLVRIAPYGASALTKQQALITDTFLNLNFAVVTPSRLTVSITPLSSVNLCRQFVSLDTFAVSASNMSLGLASVTAGPGSVSVAPNPAAGAVSVLMNGLPSGQYDCSIAGISGQVLQIKPVLHTGGNQVVSMDISGLAAGLYFVSLSGKAGQYVVKLVVQ